VTYRENGAIPPPDEPPDPYDTEGAVQYQQHRLRVNREARRRLDDEANPPVVLPALKSLTQLLAEPRTPIRYRVEGLAQERSRNLLSAQFKAGKTTMRDNLIRSLVDSEPFLGKFRVNTPARNAVVLDNELSQDMMLDWLDAQGIRNTDAVTPLSLRGHVGLFDPTDDRCRSEWARRLSDIGADHLTIDCLRPVLDSLGLDENRDAGKFLVAFDALLNEAGINDALVVQHMGHANERARGDSRLQDWPDAIWRLTRETDDPSSARYFSAYGRDVNVPEGRLSFNPVLRRMTYAAGSRTDAKAEAAYFDLIKLVAGADNAMSKNSIEGDLADEHTQKSVREAIAKAVKDGVLAVEPGPHRAKLHRIAYPCSECGLPVVTQTSRHLSCPSGPEGLFEK
jgi:hypothetical protein